MLTVYGFNQGQLLTYNLTSNPFQPNFVFQIFYFVLYQTLG